MRCQLAIQACTALCIWQRATCNAAEPPNTCRPDVDITLAAQLVAAQSPNFGTVRWAAEGLLGFAYMGLPADHPTIEALCASLTMHGSHLQHQHLLYTCMGLRFLGRVPRTLDYEALGCRINQLDLQV